MNGVADVPAPGDIAVTTASQLTPHDALNGAWMVNRTTAWLPVIPTTFGTTWASFGVTDSVTDDPDCTCVPLRKLCPVTT